MSGTGDSDHARPGASPNQRDDADQTKRDTAQRQNDECASLNMEQRIRPRSARPRHVHRQTHGRPRPTRQRLRYPQADLRTFDMLCVLAPLRPTEVLEYRHQMFSGTLEHEQGGPLTDRHVTRRKA